MPEPISDIRIDVDTTPARTAVMLAYVTACFAYGHPIRVDWQHAPGHWRSGRVVFAPAQPYVTVDDAQQHVLLEVDDTGDRRVVSLAVLRPRQSCHCNHPLAEHPAGDQGLCRVGGLA